MTLKEIMDKMHELKKMQLKDMNLKQFLKRYARKTCTNRYPAIKPDGTRQWYRHPDLDDLSRIAFDENKSCFYCKPADPNNKYGRQIECDPEYVYEVSCTITEEEWKELFDGESVS